jgi:hypothetical protein
MSVRHALVSAAARRWLRTVAWMLALGYGLACGWASPALASQNESTMLMDDGQLIYSSPSHVQQVMVGLRGLGLDTVKISVVWSLVAPDAKSRHKPKFKATNPNAYPNGAWDRYDRVVELAHELGMRVYFQITAPAPAWATTPGRDGRGTHPWSRVPNPQEFGQFVQAVGRRYSGSFIPAGGVQKPVITIPLTGIAIPLLGPSTQPTKVGALPPVRWWSIWNEPNEQGWLSPQFHQVNGRTTPWSPLQERNLIDAGYAGLSRSGHAGDTILIGDTSSGGAVHPVPFLRDLYCVGVRFNPLGGSSAQRLGCPTSGSRSSFVSAHPGLFHAAGYADHPYSFKQAPNSRNAPGLVTLYNLGVIERTIGRIFRTYGQGGSLPIYVTEWGYKTNPPNPYVRTTLGQQEAWLNEGEYMTWRLPFVRSFAQFELRDDKPRRQYRRGSQRYWSTFQTGLEFSNGNAKPSYRAFRIPIWVPWAHPGRAVTVWGQLRPADHAHAQSAVLEYRRSSRAKWSSLRTVQTANSEGFLLNHVRIAQPGMIRLAWRDPGSGAVDYSRTVKITR